MNAQRILSIEYNTTVLEARNAVLRSAGYEVTSAGTFYQVLERLQENRFDLVLVGRSIPGVHLRGFMQLAQVKAPEAKTMVLLDSPESAEPTADGSFDLTNGPEALVAAIEQLLARSKATSA